MRRIAARRSRRKTKVIGCASKFTVPLAGPLIVAGLVPAALAPNAVIAVLLLKVKAPLRPETSSVEFVLMIINGELLIDPDPVNAKVPVEILVLPP